MLLRIKIRNPSRTRQNGKKIEFRKLLEKQMTLLRRDKELGEVKENRTLEIEAIAVADHVFPIKSHLTFE